MFYELVLLVRPDVSMGQIGELFQSIKTLIQDQQGSIDAAEYWGFRTLAYRIEKRAKAHYVFLVLNTKETSLKPLYHYLKFQRDVMRFLLIKKPDGVTLPTSLYQSDLGDAVAGIGPSSPVVSSAPAEPIEDLDEIEEIDEAEETLNG
jgi:small subunit ribosomal protein S6